MRSAAGAAGAVVAASVTSTAIPSSRTSARLLMYPSWRSREGVVGSSSGETAWVELARTLASAARTARRSYGRFTAVQETLTELQLTAFSSLRLSVGCGLEQLDRVARRVVEQDLAAAGATDDVVANPEAGGPEPVDLGVDIGHDEVDAVPAPWLRCTPVGHRPAGRARRSGEK